MSIIPTLLGKINWVFVTLCYCTLIDTASELVLHCTNICAASEEVWHCKTGHQLGMCLPHSVDPVHAVSAFFQCLCLPLLSLPLYLSPPLPSPLSPLPSPLSPLPSPFSPSPLSPLPLSPLPSPLSPLPSPLPSPLSSLCH